MELNEWIETVPEDLFEKLKQLPSHTVKTLSGLNPSQLRAVMAVEGPVQINATAGSGKTRVLTRRIAYMKEVGIKPKNILCTTFTKKATTEMQSRLEDLVPKMYLQQITLGTSHSIGYRILSKEYSNLNHPLAKAFKNPRMGVLMNGSLKIFVEKTIKELMNDMTVDFDIKKELKEMTRPQLLKVVSGAKNSNVDAYQFEGKYAGENARMDAYCEFYKRYEQRKMHECKIDADDMLFLLVRLFQEHEDILAKYQEIYKYLLVDEAQDNNELQYTLIRMLGFPEYNVFLVGDDDQAMYSFRGAKPQEFINFSTNYEGAVQIPLEDNYRSSPHILITANKLIKNNTVRLVKELKPNKADTGECVSYSKYEDESDEARECISEVQTLIDKEGYKAKEICFLYRTNAQSQALEDKLITSGIPYVIHGGISFYERKEVKDLVAYLKLANDLHDNKAFSRVINVPSRYLGKAFMEKVNSFNGSNWEAIQPGVLNLKGYEVRGTTDFMELVDKLQNMNHDGLEPIEILEYIMAEGGYKDYILGEDDEEESSRLENIETLKFVVEQYENIEDFLKYMDKMTSKAKHSIDGVQLMTIHKSKGLEFPVVFIVGSSEGLLPHYRAVEEEKSKSLPIEEERRLMYVAVTRAESRCYISSVRTFSGKKAGMSRFITELGLVDSSSDVNDSTEEDVFPEVSMEDMR